MRRVLPASILAVSLIASAIVLPTLSQAADGTGVYGTWTASGGEGTLTFTGTVFPNATFTTTDASVSVARSATLTSTTPFGAQYGTSSGKTYLTSAIASGKPSGTLTITFDAPPVPGTWGMAFGDVDAENLMISGTLADDSKVDISDWGIETFNYAGQTDVPTYDPATGRMVGSGVDTSGATVWLSPSQPVTSVTITQERASGFPQYQLWIAADVIAATAVVPSPSITPAVAPTNAPGKVTICHATSSAKNPYVEVTVSENAITRKNGHGEHTGGLYPTVNWGDIIPPFPGFAGLNWPAGSAILANNCETGSEDLNFMRPIGSASPMASPSVSATASASPSASATASPSASPSASATASPSASPSASATVSVSATATPSASASASASVSGSASPSPSPSVSASPSASVSPTSTPSPTTTPTAVTVDPEQPLAVVVDPREPIAITIEPAAEIIDVTPPSGGTVTVREDTVTFTPNPGVTGRQEIEVTYVDRGGVRSSTTLVVNVRPMAATSVLPTLLRLGANTFAIDLPRASAQVRCAPLLRIKAAGDVRLCSTRSSGDRTVVTVNAPARVTVSVIQRGTTETSLIESRTYVVRR